MKIRHFGYPIWDMELELKYYLGLGLKVKSDTTEKVRIVKLEDKDGMVLELLQYESQGPGKEPHVAFTRDPENNLIEVVDDVQRKAKTKLAQVRQERKMSQLSLAKLTNIAPSDLSRIENHRMVCYPDWKKRLSHALRISEYELFPLDEKGITWR